MTETNRRVVLRIGSALLGLGIIFSTFFVQLSAAGICPTGFTYSAAQEQCISDQTSAVTCPPGTTGPVNGQCTTPARALPDIYWRCEDWPIEPGYNHVQIHTQTITTDSEGNETIVDNFEIDDHDVDQTTSWACSANKEVNLVARSPLNTQIAWFCDANEMPAGYEYIGRLEGGNYSRNRPTDIDINSAGAPCFGGRWHLITQSSFASNIAWWCSGPLVNGYSSGVGVTESGTIDQTRVDIDTDCGDDELAIATSLSAQPETTAPGNCPTGFVVSGATCQSTATTPALGFEIEQSNINPASGDCTPDVVNNGPGSLTTCTFDLQNVPASVPLQLPTEGVTAQIPGATGAGTCAIQAQTLVCSNIPAEGAELGDNDVTTSLGGIATVTVELPSLEISESNLGLGECDGSNVNQGDTFDCFFPLTGNPDNKYNVPAGGIQGSISNDLTSTNPVVPPVECEVVNNETPEVGLLCQSITTTGIGAGVKNVVATLNGGNIDRGNINLLPPATPITAEMIGIGDCNGQVIAPGDRFDCTFPLEGANANRYVISDAGIQASISGNPNDFNPVTTRVECEIINNITPQAALLCQSIFSEGAGTGTRNVVLAVDTIHHDRGDVLISNNAGQVLGANDNSGTIGLVRSGGSSTELYVGTAVLGIILSIAAGVDSFASELKEY